MPSNVYLYRCEKCKTAYVFDCVKDSYGCLNSICDHSITLSLVTILDTWKPVLNEQYGKLGE